MMSTRYTPLQMVFGKHFSLCLVRELLFFCLQATESKKKKLVCTSQHFSSVFRFYFFSLNTSATLFSYSEWFFIGVRTTDAIILLNWWIQKICMLRTTRQIIREYIFFCVLSRVIFSLRSICQSTNTDRATCDKCRIQQEKTNEQKKKKKHQETDSFCVDSLQCCVLPE